MVATEAHIYFNPDSSPKLPADPEWSRSQALFEDAVGDGTYFADPNFEWEEEVEETKQGGQLSGFPARRRARRPIRGPGVAYFVKEPRPQKKACCQALCEIIQGGAFCGSQD